MIGDVTARRELNIAWRDPYAALERGREISGLEYMRALLAGEFPPPPIAELMDFTLVSVDEGRAIFRGVPGEQHLNPIGSVHGGFAATLLDSALGCAVHTTLPAGVGYSTLELAVNLVRGITPATGPVRRREGGSRRPPHSHRRGTPHGGGRRRSARPREDDLSDTPLAA
jgi:uncharacterized protein (TIGR00369 family)